MKHLITMILAFILAGNCAYGQSSFFWQVTHPQTGVKSHILGIVNSQDRRARLAAEGWYEALKNADILLVTEDPALTGIAEMNFSLYLEDEYVQQVMEKSDFPLIDDSFSQLFGETLADKVRRSTTVRSLYSQKEIDRISYSLRPHQLSDGLLPNEYFLASALKTGVPYQFVGKGTKKESPGMIPPGLYERYILSKIDLITSFRKDSIFFGAFQAGDTDFFNDWGAQADDLDYLSRIGLNKSDSKAEQAVILQAIQDIPDEKSFFLPVHLTHLIGENGILKMLESLGFEISEIESRLSPFPEIPEANYPVRWEEFTEANLPFTIALPGGSPVSYADIPYGTDSKISLDLFHLYPFEQGKLSIWRIPSYPAPEGERTAFLRSMIEVLPFLLDKSFSRSLDMSLELLDDVEVLTYNGIPPDYSRSGVKEYHRKALGFFTDYEFIVIAATGLESDAEKVLTNKILRTFRWKELSAWNLSSPEEGFSARLPGYPQDFFNTEPYRATEKMMNLHYWGGTSQDMRHGVSISSSIVPSGIFIINDSLEMATRLEINRSTLNYREVMDIYSTLSPPDSQYNWVGQLRFSWIRQTHDMPSPPHVSNTMFVRAGRYFNISIVSTEEDRLRQTDWKEYFQELPFPSPSLTRWDSPVGYSIPLPQQPALKSLPKQSSAASSYYDMIESIWISQDTFSGINVLGIESTIGGLVESNPEVEAIYTITRLQDLMGMRYADLPVPISDSSFTLHGLEMGEFFLDLPQSSSQMRVLYALNGNKKLTLMTVAPPDLIRTTWLDQLFYGVQNRNMAVIPPIMFNSHADEIISILNHGSTSQIDTALYALDGGEISSHSVDKYLDYLRTDPPFMHPDQYKIFPVLISTLYLSDPVKTDEVVREIMNQNQDPSLQVLILNTLLRVTNYDVGKTITHGIRQTNWRGFSPEVMPLYRFVLASFSSADGSLLWAEINQLITYQFWKEPLLRYLPEAEKEGLLTGLDLSIVKDTLDQKLSREARALFNLPASFNDERRYYLEYDLSVTLHALSIFEAPTNGKEILEVITQNTSDRPLKAQIDCNRIIWGYGLDDKSLSEWLELPGYRKRFLWAQKRASWVNSLTIPYLEKSKIAECDVYLSISNGGTEMELEQLELWGSWQEGDTERFVFFFVPNQNEEGYYIVSPAYGSDPFSPVHTENTFLSIPERFFDQTRSAKSQFALRERIYD